MRSLLRFGGLCAALFLCVVAAHATSVSELPDGTIVQYGEKSDVPYLARWTNGAWAPIPVAPELVPGKGEFEGVGADAQGNLYVSYTDETNEKKKTSGLLARVNGNWSRLGAFDKNWSPGSQLAALSPAAVYLRVHLIKERKPAVVRWDGSAYSTVPLPAGMEDVNGLMVHDAALVMLAYGRGPSGNYGDGNICYRMAGGTWEQMGAPAAKGMELLLRTPGGTLWRLGRTAERWDGIDWERGFTFDGSYFDGYRITAACSGTNGEVYAVLNDADHKDHLACVTADGRLRWLKGNAEASRFAYGLYDPFCDTDGSLHVDHAGEALRFTLVDFDYNDDGYPTQDERAQEVYGVYLSSIPKFNAISRSLGALDSIRTATGKQADALTYKDKTLEGMVWSSEMSAQLKALGLAKGRNRMHDKLLAFAEAFKQFIYLNGESVKGGSPWDEDPDNRRRWMKAYTQVEISLSDMKQEVEVYPARNGLTKP